MGDKWIRKRSELSSAKSRLSRIPKRAIEELAFAMKSRRRSSAEELSRLLDAARDKHAERGEWFAVAALLEVAVAAAGSTDASAIVALQAKVLRDELFDEDGAKSLSRLLELARAIESATQGVEEAEGKRKRYPELLKGYLEEAEGAQDDVYRGSMLMRAAEMDLRFASPDQDQGARVERLERAVRLDPTNERAAQMLEVLPARAALEDVERTLERLADRAEQACDSRGWPVCAWRVFRAAPERSGAGRACLRPSAEGRARSRRGRWASSPSSTRAGSAGRSSARSTSASCRRRT